MAVCQLSKRQKMKLNFYAYENPLLKNIRTHWFYFSFKRGQYALLFNANSAEAIER